ncbi:MAG: hypothetical protein V4692_00465, partial [Bdellovibrionota bacterium]
YSEAVIVTDGVTNEDIRQGALVLVDALDTTVVKKRSPLGRSVWVRSTDSLPLKFDGKTEVDLKAYATRQIRDVISMEETKGRYYVIDPDLE